MPVSNPSSGPSPIRVRDLASHDGAAVRLQGWLYNRRGKGKIQFLLLRDGSGIAQCVLLRDAVEESLFEAAKTLPLESSLTIDGVVKVDERAPGGAELGVTALEIHQEAEPYPIGKKEHGAGFLMDHRHLWLRSKRQSALLRLRHRIIQSLREYLDDGGFCCVDSPMFTPNACEGTSTLFQLDYFGETAYLTQSGQLYAEAAAMALGKVYCFGPVFRAEKSKTRRHLTEFWMLEPEIAYADLDEICATAEGLIRHTIRRVLSECGTELRDLERDPAVLEAWDAPFPRLTYDEAADLLTGWKADGSLESEFQPGDDLGAPDESALGEHFGRPVMVTHWPAEVKAFYMKRDAGGRVLGVDIIAPVAGEIVGGSVREDDLALLEQRVADHDLPEEAFRWYLDLRRYGTVPHGGFGLGLERTVAWLSGTEHVRECIPFPRTISRLAP